MREALAWTAALVFFFTYMGGFIYFLFAYLLVELIRNA